MQCDVLAVDYGASGGRAMLVHCDGQSFEMRQVHRFSYEPIYCENTLCWPMEQLFFELKQSIIKAKAVGSFESIAIDTWGVDFGLLDENGTLLANPAHYRDERTIGMMDEVFKIIPKKELYQITGIQFMRINTIYQLFSLIHRSSEIMKKAERLLMMPSLLSFLLTGEKRAEFTSASTSQMIDASTRDWSIQIKEKLGIPSELLPPTITCGEAYGMLSEEICKELQICAVPVIATASHDTAAAVVAVPTQEEDFVYLSCGTWSLFGTQTDQPVINETTYQLNMTNSAGYEGKNLLLKNIMGLWLIQESRRQWKREGMEITFAQLEAEAFAAKGFQSFVDPDDPLFEQPGDMPERIRTYCRNTNQTVPDTRGEIVRCIYESLALKYKYALGLIENVTGKVYQTLHIIGGGSQDALLCRFTADSCKIRVTAGPVEATILGNAAVQSVSLGVVADLKEARRIISNSFERKEYVPAGEDWTGAYEKFLLLLQNKSE
ncbi:MAG: rhamnulokinase [Clostridiales bacterium 43-6]|nr:MAG: rhamnulokinase [Clostridiales bacterium 43-6]